MQLYQPPLAVYVVWHPRLQRGEDLAKALYAHLCNNPQRPAERRMGIPVRFRSGPRAAGEPLPSDIHLDGAEHSAVVVLVDDEMVADDAWGSYVTRIWQQSAQSGSRHRVFPVSLSDNAFALDPAVSMVNFIRLHDSPADEQPLLLKNRVTHELCRLLLNRPRAGDEQGNLAAGPAPITVFISHAKAGGLDLAKEVRDYIQSHMQLKTFFDAPDTPEGRRVWCHCLAAMRRKMNEETNARIFLGGRETGFNGFFPGLVEEAHLAISAGKPVYLLGGFGGCTAVIVDALRGRSPEALTIAYHRATDPIFAAMLAAENASPDLPAAYDSIREDFHRTGLNGLKNGLSEAENQRLCETDDIDEMAVLVLKGLTALP